MPGSAGTDNVVGIQPQVVNAKLARSVYLDHGKTGVPFIDHGVVSVEVA
jgi:hypothetical protein